VLRCCHRTGRHTARGLNSKICWILINSMLEGVAVVVHSVLVALVIGRSILGYNLRRVFDIHLGQIGVGILLVWLSVLLLVWGNWRHERGIETMAVICDFVVSSS
jgi:hypothetical protein